MDCPYRWSTRESNLRALLAAMSAIGSSLETPHKFLVQNGIVNNPTRPKWNLMNKNKPKLTLNFDDIIN